MRIYHSSIAVFSVLLFFAFMSRAEKPSDEPWRIHKVHFTGNSVFKRYELLNIISMKPVTFEKNPRYTKGKSKSDMNAIRQLYMNYGYLDVVVEAEKEEKDSVHKRVEVTYAIDEGEQTIIKSIEFNTSSRDSLLIRSLKCKTGKPLLQIPIMADEKKLRDSRTRKGYLYATVTSHQYVDSVNHFAHLRFVVNDGPLIVVDAIRYSGISSLKPEVVRREIVFKPGDTLTRELVRKSERRLYRTNLLSSVSIDAELSDTSIRKSDSTATPRFPITITLREIHFFRLKIGAGYGSGDGARGSVETSYSNLFRLGHRLTFKGNASLLKQQAQAIYTTPWFLGLPLRFNSSFYFNRFSNVETYRGLFRGIMLSVEQTTEFNLLYQFWTKLEDALWITSKDLPDNFPEKNTQSFGIKLTYDTRDDFLDASKGVYHLMTGELAGITGNNSYQFYKLTSDTRIYWKIGKVRWASGLKLGWARPYGKSEIVPVQDQFYGGGSQSVRGFKEDYLLTRYDTEEGKTHASSGTILATANLLEMRFKIYKIVSGALFADAGYIWDSLHGATVGSVLKDIRWTAGPGLRINTPLAVIRFDVGFKLDKKPHELMAQWHLDVGQSF
jgi:outer membrane protein insertion porin family